MVEMNRKFSIIATALILAACGQESAIQKSVRGSLKDPESAKFGESTVLDNKFACMTVNAKTAWVVTREISKLCWSKKMGSGSLRKLINES